jgi:hypothetical protein
MYTLLSSGNGAHSGGHVPEEDALKGPDGRHEGFPDWPSPTGEGEALEEDIAVAAIVIQDAETFFA